MVELREIIVTRGQVGVVTMRLVRFSSISW